MVTAGTSPFGDPPALSAKRIAAGALLARRLLPLEQALKVHCSGSPIHFDALAHHPYPIGPPRRHAPNPDDVVIADFSRITKPLSVALKRGTVLPRTKKQIWATELSWESKPPDPEGIPDHLRATYMDGAFNELWSEGVNTVVWFNMRDQLPRPDFAVHAPVGHLLRSRRQHSRTTRPSSPTRPTSFPFTAYLKKGKAQIWGLAPAPGPVTIQALRGSTWTPVMHSERALRPPLPGQRPSEGEDPGARGAGRQHQPPLDRLHPLRGLYAPVSNRAVPCVCT